MALENERLMDETSWHILQELQQNARSSFTELGQRVGLSLPAVSERVRKMEEAGIISGYHAEVNLDKLGIPVMAIIQLQGIGGQNCLHAVSQVSKLPEVLECYRITGNDSIIIKVVATSLEHLALVIDQLSLHGIPTTSFVRSRPVKRHTISNEIHKRANGQEGILGQESMI
jgi:Lrp/AsnC family leucine-responsive transcriptional regulator